MIKILGRSADADVWINAHHVIKVWRHPDHYTRIQMVNGHVIESADTVQNIVDAIKYHVEPPT